MDYKVLFDSFRRSPQYKRDLRYFAILYIITLVALAVMALLSVESLVRSGMVPQADRVHAFLTSVGLWFLAATGGYALALGAFHVFGMVVVARARTPKGNGRGAGKRLG